MCRVPGNWTLNKVQFLGMCLQGAWKQDAPGNNKVQFLGMYLQGAW